MGNRLSEWDLILPSLQIICQEWDGGISTSDLIPKLRELLTLSEEDTVILQWRRDDKFSQKVRNLVSHKTLERKWYAKFKDWKFIITSEWANYLKSHGQILSRIIEKGQIVDGYDAPIQSYFSIFNEAIWNIEKLLKLQIDKSLEQSYMNMLYASMITILETYLYDALKFHIFNQPNDGFLRKFIEQYEQYQEEQFYYKKLYELYEHREDKVSETIDAISYHRLNDISSLYRSIFWIEFNKKSMSEILKAIYKRHDLVHRNGKKKNWQSHNITKEDVEALMTLIKEFVEWIESGIQTILGTFAY